MKSNKKNNSHNAAPDWRRQDPDYAKESRKYADPIPSRAYIRQCLVETNGPRTEQELLAEFKLRGASAGDAFQRRIQAMLKGGELVQNRRGALGPASRMHAVAGTVQGHRDGFGFLIPDDGSDDIFLAPRQMREVMHGDRITVRVTGRDPRGRPEGSLVDVLEHKTVRVVGRYVAERGVGYVIPDNARITHEILVPQEHVGAARHGQIVTAEILSPPGKHSAPIGRVVEVLGDALAPGMEIDIAVRSHNLPHVWPQAALAEAALFAQTVPESAARGRTDLRELPLVTIDGADARDFDDAVYAEPAGEGWKLWVAIADVAHYVAPDSALDKEARERGNSVYFPERVIPMLPEGLSNGLCSLNPKVDRLCLACEMLVDRDGHVGKARFHNAVMRSQSRLTYDAVAALLNDPRLARAQGLDELLPHLLTLQNVFRALFRARSRRGAIDFETTETKIVFDAQRKIARILPLERNQAHRLIEECMIAANVQAAKFLARHKLPQLYRVHEGPPADKLLALREFLGLHSLSLGGGAKPKPADYARVLQQLEARPDRKLIQTVLLRSMAQAVYSPVNIGHFGLALEHYGHFTSPIRRYPDLMTHRAIKHALANGAAEDFAYKDAGLQALGVHCSMTERRADEATRDAVTWLKCEFMQERVGEEFDGTITGVVPFGLFVELEGVYVEGLVHVSSLRNDYYRHEPRGECLRGERSGVVYRLADRLRVRVVRVNLDERKIDFELAAVPAVQKPNTSRSKKR
ncbi:MAG: ribonuclease R [Nevskiales bacterium]